MRKVLFITFSFLLLCAMPLMADDVEQTLTINGETVEKAVVSITFDGDNVVLHFDDASEQSADMNTVTLNIDVSGTGISVLKGEVTDRLSIEGLPEGTPVTIYDASGRLVLSSLISPPPTGGVRGGLDTGCPPPTGGVRGGLSSLISHLPHGVYVLKAGNHIVKFVKR